MSDYRQKLEQGEVISIPGLDVGVESTRHMLRRLIIGQTIAVSLLAIFIALGGLLTSESRILALVPLGVIAVAVGLLSFGFLQVGQVTLASYLFLLGTSVAITSHVLVRGFQDVSAIYYSWPIMAAVFLLGTRGGFLVTSVSAIMYVGVTLIQWTGYYVPLFTYDADRDALYTVAARLIMFFLLAFLGWLSSQNLGRALRVASGAARQWRELNETLEQRVVERTQALEKRAAQLQIAAGVGRAAASILELEVLTRRVVHLVREGFDFYHVGLFLLDQHGRYAELVAGTGEAGRQMWKSRHKLEVGGQSMVGAACSRRQARIALDVGEEPVRFDNPLLPKTRSEMALPLMVGERVLGALDVQSTIPAAFSEEDIAVLQLVADLVAVAIDNAHKFSAEAELLQATSPLYRISHRLATAGTTEEIVQVVISSVADTEADGCALGRLGYTADGHLVSGTFLGVWSRHTELEIPIGIALSTEASPVPLDMMRTPWMIEDVALYTQMRERPRRFLGMFGGRAFLNIPLRSGRQIIGFLGIHRKAPGPFSPMSLRVYETIAEQAAVALERARLLEEIQRQAWREHTIREVTETMRSAMTVEEAVSRAMRDMGRALGVTEMVARIGTARDLLSRQEGNGHE